MSDQFIQEKRYTKNSINAYVIDNYAKLKPSLFFLPLFLLLLLVVFLYSRDSLSVAQYIEIQKNLFYFLNSKLSHYPTLVYNLTQFGDALVFLSFITLFVLYAPKIWEALLSASLVSAIFSGVLKNLFSVPRPAAAFDTTSFVIIGRTLPGHSSLPSGHSITIFTVLSVLLFAFMPKKGYYKLMWIFLIISTGIMLVFTRVAVGAHYPLDVTVGSIVGYLSGIIGIFISQKYKIWDWINHKKYYPIFMVLFLICGISLISNIINENLIIFYFSLATLIVSLYKITYVYLKK